MANGSTTTTPTIGRQLRIGVDEHAALLKAAVDGQQNTYIRAALRRQLERDGHLERPQKTQHRYRSGSRIRARKARAAR